MDLGLEHRVRAAAFAWLDAEMAREGDVLPAGSLRLGFPFGDARVPLTVQQGIHKPKFLSAALSLRTSHGSPYDDAFDGEDVLLYRYRGSDPDAWDNVAARLAFRHQLPLVYLHEVVPGRYAVVKPAYIVGDDPTSLTFRVQTEALAEGPLGASVVVGADLREVERSYRTRLVRARLHQTAFRERVLAAYRSTCAMCSLRHAKLLDAAHIVPDRDVRGEPLVTNGLSLCRIHHAAFDVHYLSVDPASMRIQVQRRLLDEEDGPMLRHGLQALHGAGLHMPTRKADRPDRDRLAEHFARFRDAS